MTKKTQIGKPFVRGGQVFAYVYHDGKRTARDLVRITQLRPKDLLKGAKPAVVSAALLTTLNLIIKGFELRT